MLQPSSLEEFLVTDYHYIVNDNVSERSVAGIVAQPSLLTHMLTITPPNHILALVLIGAVAVAVAVVVPSASSLCLMLS